MFWGYSPALDLLSEYKQHHSLEGKTELNILVAASSDIRHILVTIAKYYRYVDAQNLTINFYITDLLLEFMARELLLTLIALEPSERIGLKEKADLWMEIYGNSMLRSTTSEYLTKKSYQFIKIITDKKYQLKRLPCVDLDNIKYAERDSLEFIFKFWVKNEFNMAVNWDRRVRKYLGTRYDSRMGAFDWDYYMKVKDIKEGKKINSTEYKQWRNTGIAFSWLEKEFSISNPTLALDIRCSGDELVSLNYLGDILCGPYYSFGLDCEDSEMLDTRDDQYVKRATDITERNLMRMFYEIENQSKYEVTCNDSRDLGVAITEMVTLNFDDVKTKVKVKYEEEDYTGVSVKHKLIFLPINSVEDQAKLLKFYKFFDLAILGQGLWKALNNDVINVVKDEGLIIMETRKYALWDIDEQKKFNGDLLEKIKEGNCELIGDKNYDDEIFLRFRRKVNNEKEGESRITENKEDSSMGENEQNSTLAENKDSSMRENEENSTLGENKEDSSMGENEENSTLGENKEDSSMVENEQNSTLGENEENSTLGENKEDSSIRENEENSTLGENEQNSSMGENEQNSTLGENEENSTLGENKEDSSMRENEENSTLGENKEDSSMRENEENSTLGENKEDSSVRENGYSTTKLENNMSPTSTKIDENLSMTETKEFTTIKKKL